MKKVPRSVDIDSLIWTPTGYRVIVIGMNHFNAVTAPPRRPFHRLTTWALSAFVVLAACPDDVSTSPSTATPDVPVTETADGGGAPVMTCEQAAPTALRQCVVARSAATATCYETSNGACAADATPYAAASEALATAVTGACMDNDFPNRSVEDLIARLDNACISESDSHAWRVYGGPHGAVWAQSDETTRACLSAAHSAGTTLLNESMESLTLCALDEACDPSELSASRESSGSSAVATVNAACEKLDTKIGVTPEILVSRIAHQADCLAAAGHVNADTLPIACGAGFVQFDAPRGEWLEVTIDSETFGTQCGDGSDYRFWVKLAPEGSPLDRVFVGLQGGGVCVFEEDCSTKQEGLFRASDVEDTPYENAITSADPSISPFADWTHVYLPYCTQDVFAGGGVVETFENLSVSRYGSVNLRTAVRMVRDVIWKKMDAESGPGFRPDQLLAMFGGWSAGGYGTLYNYHWFLDDLQWPKTIAFPDAGLALDNQELLGVKGLGAIKIPVWGTRANLPPYCFIGDCAVGDILYAAISPRLKQVPEQQIMVLTNPLDDTQMFDAYFSDRPTWLNAVRKHYCDNRDLPGISFFYTSVSDESVHVVSLRSELWDVPVAGISMKDWLWTAVEDPDSVTSRAEEANFAADISGVEPFPCALP